MSALTLAQRRDWLGVRIDELRGWLLRAWVDLEDWSFDGGVPVVEVTRNGGAADPGGVEGRVVRLAGGEECRVVFAIDRFLADASPAGAVGE